MGTTITVVVYRLLWWITRLRWSTHICRATLMSMVEYTCDGVYLALSDIGKDSRSVIASSMEFLNLSTI